MRASGVTGVLCKAIEAKQHDFILCNYANGDMVGHSGVLSAAVKAVEVVDGCLARALGSAERAGATLLVTADHGNCELMIDPTTDGPHTAHTTNPVPFLIVGDDARGPLRHGGALCEVGPTLLRMLAVEPPPEMTGRDLWEVGWWVLSRVGEYAGQGRGPARSSLSHWWEPPILPNHLSPEE